MPYLDELRELHGRPTKAAVDDADSDYYGDPTPIEGWRQEHAHRVLAAVQATAVFVVMMTALAWREELQEGLHHELARADFSVF